MSVIPKPTMMTTSTWSMVEEGATSFVTEGMAHPGYDVAG